MSGHPTMNWLCALLIVLSQFRPSLMQIQVASACFGGSDLNCDYITPSCDGLTDRILLSTLRYGVKPPGCKEGKRCMNGNGCCSFSETDCSGDFNTLHALDLYTPCSGEPSCGPRQVPWAPLAQCGSALSDYAYVFYYCIPAYSVIGFCESIAISGTSIHIVFDSRNKPNGSSHSDCSCTVRNTNSNGGQVHTSLLDVRLTKSRTESSLERSRCSSAKLRSTDLNILEMCDPSRNDEENFSYFTSVAPVDVSNRPRTISLQDVYRTGPSDAPQMVWVELNATSEINVRCGAFEPTIPVTTIPTTDDTNVNGTAVADELTSGSNTGVIVGVTIPLLLVLAGVGVFLFVFWRKGRLCKERKRDNSNGTASARFSNHSLARNDTINNTYAEIGEITSLERGENHAENNVYHTCDTLSNPITPDSGSANCAAGQANGHAHNDVQTWRVKGTVDKAPSSRFSNFQKTGKSVYNAVKDKGNRVLSFFNIRKSEDEAHCGSTSSAVANGVEQTRFRNLRAKGEFDIIVIRPDCEEDAPKIDNPTANTAISVNKTDISTQANSKRPPSPLDMKAVKMADQYIEFQLGEGSEGTEGLAPDKPPRVDSNLLTPGFRPAKPSRPAPVLDNQHRSASHSSLITQQQQSSEPAEDIMYDYADVGDDDVCSVSSNLGNAVREANATPSGDLVYDYAEDVTVHARDHSPRESRMVESFYEDVDGKRVKSVRNKNVSSAPGSQYYEVPLPMRHIDSANPKRQSENYVDAMPFAPPVPVDSQQIHLEPACLEPENESKPQGTRKPKSAVIYQLQKAIISKTNPNTDPQQPAFTIGSNGGGDTDGYVNLKPATPRGKPSPSAVTKTISADQQGVRNMAKKFEFSAGNNGP